MRTVKGFYMRPYNTIGELKYYCPYCNDIYGIYTTDRCRHYVSHDVTFDTQNINLIDEKNEAIFQIEKIVSEIRDQAGKELCSHYLMSLIERLQDLVSLIEEVNI